MDQNSELLRAVYENARVGKLTLAYLIKRCEDATFRNLMAAQFAEYHNLLSDAGQLGRQYGVLLEDVCIPRAPILASLRLNTAVDSTSSHFAEMVMQGSLTGIIDAARRLRELPEAAEDIRAIARRLLYTEENNLRQMQGCL